MVNVASMICSLSRKCFTGYLACFPLICTAAAGLQPSCWNSEYRYSWVTWQGSSLYSSASSPQLARMRMLVMVRPSCVIWLAIFYIKVSRAVYAPLMMPWWTLCCASNERSAQRLFMLGAKMRMHCSRNFWSVKPCKMIGRGFGSSYASCYFGDSCMFVWCIGIMAIAGVLVQMFWVIFGWKIMGRYYFWFFVIFWACRTGSYRDLCRKYLSS